MQPEQDPLSPQSLEVLRQFRQLPDHQRALLLAALKSVDSPSQRRIRHQENLQPEIGLGELHVPRKDLPREIQANVRTSLLSFNNLTDSLNSQAKQLLLDSTKANCFEECLIAWGLKPDRGRAGTPNQVYEIRHAFGGELTPGDTCLVGYWFVWKPGNDEAMAEIYMLPNRAVAKSDLIKMLKSVAPDWFLHKHDEWDGPDGGVRVPTPRQPVDRGPGAEREIPREDAPIQVTLVGPAPLLVLGAG